MNLLIEAGGYGGLVPAAVAFGLSWLARRVLPERVAKPYALAVGLAGGFFAGYLLLPDWAPLVPTRHWHWLPWIGLLAAAIGPLHLTGGLLAAQRMLHLLVVGAIAAALLVPAWPDLVPPRAMSMVLLTGYLTAVAVLLGGLPDRLVGPVLCGLLALAAAAIAVVLAAEVSLKLGQVAGLVAAATFGCLIASLRGDATSAVRGMIPVHAMLAGGMAYVGCVEPDPPLTAILLMPVAPLVLWAFAAGPLAGLRGWPAAMAHAAAVALSLAAVVGWILASGSE